VQTRAIDLSRGVAGLDASFDKVLLDAACTGLGTLHRRPDLLLRLGADDPARLGELQLAMLKNAAKLVRAGGVLLYSVCSPTRAEALDVAQRFEQSAPDFSRELGEVDGTEPPLREPGSDRFRSDDDGVLRIGPWVGSTFLAQTRSDSPDAYQLVRFRRARVGPA
jgi:16S rRNA (cytosine967-C5)-methyltransferase